MVATTLYKYTHIICPSQKTRSKSPGAPSSALHGARAWTAGGAEQFTLFSLPRRIALPCAQFFPPPPLGGVAGRPPWGPP